MIILVTVGKSILNFCLVLLVGHMKLALVWD